MRRAGGRGCGRRHGPFVSPGPAAHAGRRAEGGRDRREEGPEPPRRALFSGPCGCRRAGGAGCRTSGHDDRMTPPSLCFLSWRGGSPPPEAASRGPLGLRQRPEAARCPPPPLPSPGRASAAGRPPPAPHHSPCGGRSAGAGLARDAGAVGPGPGLREGRAGHPRAAAAGRERVGGGGGAAAAAGSSFVPAVAPSVAGTRRRSGSGRREAGGGQRRRRREDRRPRRLTLPAALARRHLTPPPAAAWADSEGDQDARREAWAPRGPAGGALRRLSYGRGSCVAPGSKRAPSPGAHWSALRPTDALSPPGTRAVRERGRGAGSVRQRKPRRRRRGAR